MKAMCGGAGYERPGILRGTLISPFRIDVDAGKEFRVGLLLGWREQVC